MRAFFFFFFRTKYIRLVIQHTFILCSGFLLPMASKTPTYTYLYILQAIEHRILNLLLSLSNLVLFLSVTQKLSSTHPPSASNTNPILKIFLLNVLFPNCSLPSTLSSITHIWTFSGNYCLSFPFVSLLPKTIPTNLSSIPLEFFFQTSNASIWFFLFKICLKYIFFSC